MSNKQLEVNRIAIRRFLGIQDVDEFKVDSIGKGVNIIHGPNGVGKSTLLHAVATLLDATKHQSERPTVSYDLTVAGDPWQVDIDAGHVTWLQNHQQSSAPDLGPAVNRSKYRLALEEMIAGQGERFAKVIADESRGGFDLDAAAQAVSEKFTSTTAAASLKKALNDVKQLKRKEDGTTNESASLSEQSQRLIYANEAFHKQVLHQRVVEYKEADEKANAELKQLETFPEQLKRIQGNEADTLERLDKNLRKYTQQVSLEEQRVAEATAERDQTQLQCALDDRFQNAIEADVQRLEKLEGSLRELRRQLNEHSEIASRNQKRLVRLQLTEAQLEGLSQVEVDGVSKVVHQLLSHRAEMLCLQKQKDWLEQIGDKESLPEVSEIEEASSALTRWLATPTVSAVFKRAISWPAVAASLALAGGCGAAGFQLDPRWYWGLIVPVGLTSWELFAAKMFSQDSVAEALLLHQQAFQQTGLQPPKQWSRVDVESRLRAIFKFLAEARVNHEIHARHGSLVSQLNRARINQNEIQQTLQGIENKIGIKPDIDPEWLPRFVDTLNQWCEASDKRDVVGMNYRNERIRFRQLQQSLVEQLLPFGYEELSTVESIQTAVRALKSRHSTYVKNETSRASSQRFLDEQYHPQLAKATEDREKLLCKYGLTDSTAHQLKQFCKQLPEYKSIVEQSRKWSDLRTNLLSQLEGSEHLIRQPIEKLTTQIETFAQQAAQRDSISKTIGTIEERIRVAKDSDAIDRAIATRDEASDRLEECRDGEHRNRMSALLLKHLRKRSLELSKPVVYQRAQQLLSRYTKGRLELQVNDSADDAAFHISTPRGSKTLDQLSLGERVQTMLAIRIAFLEHDEPVMLPVLLDEPLATSDARRAEEIMDTVIEIAKTGRQVFYCTARSEELSQWKTRLASEVVPHQCIDLAKVRIHSEFQSNPPVATAIVRTTVPSPDGMSREEYGTVLQVPALERYRIDPQSVHLWYVIDDLDQLKMLLEHDITTWWQLKTMLDQGDAEKLIGGQGRVEALTYVFRAVQVVLNNASIGRPPLVDRSALIESDAVSETFMDALDELAEECGGEACKLIERLDQKAPPRWRSASTEKLIAYFTDKGYLLDVKPLTQGALRLKVLSALHDDIESDRISETDLDWILSRLDIGSQSFQR